MASGEDALKVAKLLPKGNWGHWSRTIRAVLHGKRPRLDGYIDTEPDANDDDDVQRDEDARHIIILYVGQEMSHHVANAPTTRAAWLALEQQLNEARRVRAVVLAAEVSKLTQSTTESIADYLSRAQQHMVEAHDIESVTQAELLRTNLVTGLQNEYKSAFGAELIRILEDGQTENAPFSDIRDQFQSLVSRIRSMAALLLPNGAASCVAMKQENGQHVAAFQAAGEDQRLAGGRINAHQMPQQHRPREKRDTRVCHHCNEVGHIRRNCPLWKEWLSAREQNARQHEQPQYKPHQGGHQRPTYRDNSNRPPLAFHSAGHVQNFQAQANQQGQCNHADSLLQQISQLLQNKSADPPVPPSFHAPGNARMYCTQAVVRSVRREHSAEHLWLDGGSTHHVISNKDMLYDRTGSHVSSVLVAGGEKHEVTCEGKIWLDTDNGPVILCGVLLVPSFEVNLCSEGRLADKGLYIVKTSTTATVRDSETQQEVISGVRANDLYKLNCAIRRPNQPAALVATAHVPPNVSLFHRRLGHPSVKATKKLLFSNAVVGVDQTAALQSAIPAATCLICQKGKATRASFPQSRHRALTPCALIHSDLVGPFSQASNGGAVYVLTFIDDYSGYGEAIPIKRKTDVFEELKQVFARWQRQSGYQVKRLRSDRGTEYKGQIAAYLRSEGVVHETSTAYTPEQNGRAERFNRTILERVRCMLAEFELPTMLWGEAVVYAAYCRNYIPSQGQQQSPIELMFSVKPSISHLRVFGCQAIRTVPRHQRDKTECPGEQCIFVGCAEYSKAWRLMRILGNSKYKVIESIHCIFNEDVSGFSHLRRAQQQEVMMESEHQLVLNDKSTSEDEQVEADATAIEQDDEDEQVEADDAAIDQDDEDEHAAADDQREEVHSDDDSIYGDAETARRSTRANRGVPPDRFVYTAAAVINQRSGKVYAIRQGSYDEPLSIDHALRRDDAQEWVDAVNREFASLLSMGVYEECDLPPGRQAISTRLLLKIKRNQHGAIDKYKARLVARGFLQEPGFDFYEVSAPTAQSASVRALISHTVNSPTPNVIHQLDVSTAFLNAELDEEVYVQLPRQFSNGKVWRLKKALYGLKQAASAWYKTLHTAMLELGYTATSADPCLFYRNEKHRHGRVFMLFHVDDALIAGCDLEMVEKAKQEFAGRFNISDLGVAKFFLGIEIVQSHSGIFLSQAAYSQELLQKHKMADSKPKKTPFAVGTTLTKAGTLLSEEDHATYRSLVGGLLYLSVNTRPDLAYSVGSLARYMSAPTEEHMLAAKHTLRYLQGTTQLALYFPSAPEADDDQQAEMLTSDIKNRYDIRLYTDADFANCPDHRKSVSGVYICEETSLSPIAWSSKLQSLVTTSTTEAEFVAAATGVKEGLWVLKLTREMRGDIDMCDLTLCCDNEAAVALMKNPTAGTQGRSKHIDVQFQFVRERYQKKHIKVHFVPSEHQLADIFTKQLPATTFAEMRKEIGVRPRPDVVNEHEDDERKTHNATGYKQC